MTAALTVNSLDYGYFDENVIENINIRAEAGRFTGIIGSNGGGKSTILKCIYGALRPQKGRIMLGDKSLSEMNPQQLASNLAAVGQENEFAFDFTVWEMAAMGRNPHKGLFQPDTAKDREIIEDALKKTGMYTLKDRSFRQLSGGEKQRVVIARAIAQQTEVMILDEPANHLDIAYQLQIFETVKALGVTVLAAMHDLNLAALFCDRIYVVRDRHIFAEGSPEEILTAENIRKIFGVRAEVRTSEKTGKPVVSYIPDIY